MRGIGPCSTCGNDIDLGAAFVNIGPTDWHDTDRRRTVRYVPPGADIHGWSPFETVHPECYAHREGSDTLQRLVDESDGRTRPDSRR